MNEQLDTLLPVGLHRTLLPQRCRRKPGIVLAGWLRSALACEGPRSLSLLSLALCVCVCVCGELSFHYDGITVTVLSPQSVSPTLLSPSQQSIKHFPQLAH